MLTAPHVLILPGWQNSGPLHWQSLWQATHGYTRVEQHDWQRPLRGDWCARLEEVIVNHVAYCAAAGATRGAAQSTGAATLATSAPPVPQPKLLSKSELLEQDLLGLPADLSLKNSSSIVLVAHSLGCHLVAAWAAASRHTSTVRGVLLVAPPDVTRADLPPDMHSWRAPILARLPFPAICAVSGNDPFASHAAGHAMAAAWGARCVEVGARGHINSDSGLGDWPAGLALVAELTTLPNNTKSGVHRPPT
jgi:uncharacterized protein